MTVLSPSLIALRALRMDAQVKAAGQICATDEIAQAGCAVCGATIRSGEMVAYLDLKGTFTNVASLARPGGRYCCAACAALMGEQKFMKSYASGLYSEEGYRSLSSWDYRAWILHHLPKTPFLFVIASAKSHHTIWRAPVNLSDRMVVMRVGEKVMRASLDTLFAVEREMREKIAPAVEAYLQSKQARPRSIDWGKVKTSYKSPFFQGTGRDSPAYKATLSGDIARFRDFPVAQSIEAGFLDPQALRTFNRLNAAEAWLACASFATPEEPPLQHAFMESKKSTGDDED